MYEGKILAEIRALHYANVLYDRSQVELNGITGKIRVYTQTVRVNIPFTNHLKAACL